MKWGTKNKILKIIITQDPKNMSFIAPGTDIKYQSSATLDNFLRFTAKFFILIDL